MEGSPGLYLASSGASHTVNETGIWGMLIVAFLYHQNKYDYTCAP